MLKESMVLFKPYFIIKASHKNNIIHVERITHKDEKKNYFNVFFHYLMYHWNVECETCECFVPIKLK